MRFTGKVVQITKCDFWFTKLWFCPKSNIIQTKQSKPTIQFNNKREELIFIDNSKLRAVRRGAVGPLEVELGAISQKTKSLFNFKSYSNRLQLLSLLPLIYCTLSLENWPSLRHIIIQFWSQIIFVVFVPFKMKCLISEPTNFRVLSCPKYL